MADLCTDCDCDGVAYWCRNLRNQEEKITENEEKEAPKTENEEK